MDKLHCDIIEMPKIKNTSTDVLLIKTIASLMKHSEIAVDAGYDAAGGSSVTMPMTTGGFLPHLNSI